MASLYTEANKNVRKTWLLMSIFFLFVIGVGFVISYLYNAREILWIAVFVSISMNALSYWKADKIALAVSGANTASEDEYRELHRLVENLAITAGLPKPRLYVIEDPLPNAFATGRDKNHAALAVTTGLLTVLDRSELEGVIAHELAHIGNRDILLQTVVVVLVGLVTLLADFFLRARFYGGGRREGGNAGALIAIVGIVFIVLSPIIATLIQLAISRKREFLADASGALLTRYPEGLASALHKIASFPGRMRRANHATAHLFISNPFGVYHVTGFLNKLFSTHPPVEERIRALRDETV